MLCTLKIHQQMDIEKSRSNRDQNYTNSKFKKFKKATHMFTCASGGFLPGEIIAFRFGGGVICDDLMFFLNTS